MFQRILVPLDGSLYCERAIPAAAHIARLSHGSLIFIYVAASPVERDSYDTESGASETSGTREAIAYLTLMRNMYAGELEGLPVETAVETRFAPSRLASFVHLKHADLIVMCRHSEENLKHWMLKQVAQQAIRHSPIPVLILNDAGDLFPELDAIRPLRLLIPLDGSGIAEVALELAIQMISVLALPEQEVVVHLLGVVDIPTSLGNPRYPDHLEALLKKQIRVETEIYLKAASRLIQEKLRPTIQPQVTISVILDVDVPGTIVRQAEEAVNVQDLEGCDVVVLATHGRSKLQRLLFGSVTEQVLKSTRLPALVVRPDGHLDGRNTVASENSSVDEKEVVNREKVFHR